MSVDLIYGLKRVEQNTMLHLARGSNVRSSKIVKSCHGKWYYEATHYSGGKNYHLFGFDLSFGRINFYPQGTPLNPYFYMHQVLSKSNTTNTRMPFSVDDEHTVGVGIDVDAQRFYVFYKNNYAYYDFLMPRKCTNLYVAIWGADLPYTDDNVSINFGAKHHGERHPRQYHAHVDIREELLLLLLLY